MQLEEQRQAAIMTYVNLMRIKAHETAENKELDYQIRVAKVVLQNFGIDYSELVLHLPINYPFLLASIPFYCVVFGQRCHRIASLKRLV
jgi:hypothetical protein